MPNVEDLLPPGGGRSIARRFAAIESDIEQLRAARRVASTTISGTGSILTVNNGAAFQVLHPSGTPVFKVARDSFGKYANQMSRDNGSLLFGMGVVGSQQFWAFFDRSGRVIFSDDGFSGAGIGRPWLPYPMYPQFQPSAPAAGAVGTWIVPNGVLAKWEGHVSIQHPVLAIKGNWGVNSGTGTSVTYAALINGNTIGSWTITSGIDTTIRTFTVTPYVGLDFAKLEIGITASSGTGPPTFACGLLGAWGRQS